ncbi:MAG: hypothetical protein M1816_005526 [Peltula sp. TS41687]|nr:MAG: hypothetical protein M1816_005526 [Peltula sp. TS41687]
MASGSLKEVIKALVGLFSTPTPSFPLPEDVQEVIRRYLEKHEDIEDQDSQRLQDELLNLYNKLVSGDVRKQSAFLATLRQLRPAIRGDDRLLRWWKLLLRPIFDSLGRERDLALPAHELLLSILIYEEDEDLDDEGAHMSALFAQEVLDMYLEKSSIPGVDHDGTAIMDEDTRVVGSHLEAVLVEFGKKKPKDLITCIDTLLEIKEHRRQALSLLCTFVRFQPPHLYLVVQTPLIDHLLQCLMIDTSTTVVSLALLGLVMFLPHIPGSLVPYLPRLFIVYSRLLCWDRHHGPPRTGEDSAGEEDEEESHSLPAQLWTYTESSWDKLHSSFDVDGAVIPDLTHYFSFLYGLYPENFMGFIRKPNRYLRNAKFPGLERLDLDQDSIRQRTERYRQVHILHPNFYNTTVEAELIDLTRFLKCEPSDIVAQCLELCIAIPQVQAVRNHEPRASAEAYMATEDIPRQSLLASEDGSSVPQTEDHTTGRLSEYDGTMAGPSISRTIDGVVESLDTLRRSSQYSDNRSSTERLPKDPASPDSPTLPAHLVPPPAENKVREMLQTQELLRSILQQPPTTEAGGVSTAPVTTSPQLSAYVNSLANMANRSPVIRPISSESRNDMALLQREVLLLRNDLNFERFLKQQHLSHIGQLQRKHIREATAEAETQNLINTNRALRIKAEETKRAYATLRKETAASRNHSKKWESELNAKTRALREQQKRWEIEEQYLRRELSEAREEANRLRGLLVESEAKELVSRQKLEALEASMGELEKLRQEVEQMDQRLRGYEAREDEFERAKRNEETVYTQLETARLRLQSRDADREKLKRAYDQRISELEARLRSAQTQQAAQSPQSLQAMIDSALASSRSRFENLKKVHNRLLSRHAELEIAYMDLQAAAELGGSIKGRPGSSRPGQMDLDLFDDDDATEMSSMGRQEVPRDLMGVYEGYNNNNHNYGVSRMTHISTSAPVRGQTGLGLREGTPPTSHSNESIGSDTISPKDKRHTSSDGITISSIRSASRSGNSGSQDGKKQKIKPNSGVRVYGRGGVQNIGKKEKDSDKKDKDRTSGKTAASRMGFRGLGH